MNKQEYQNLMNLTFKSSFISNNLAKLLSKEITPEDYKKLITEKMSEISLKNPSLTEDQKYQMLMTAKDDKIEAPTQPTTSPKVVETFEKHEKNEIKKVLQNNFSTVYIMLLIFTLGLSMLMAGLNLKLGKPALISEASETNEGNFKILEDANENDQDLELMSGDNMKLNLNFKKNSLLIMPKMKKIVFPTFEGVLGFVIKYGLSVVNISIGLFGRFFKDKIKWLKIRVAMIFIILPFIRIYMLYKINQQFVNNYSNQNLEFYKSKELFQYNPKNLPYNLYVEIANSLFSLFLALNHISAYVIDIFYKSNNLIVEYIKNIFELKNKLN